MLILLIGSNALYKWKVHRLIKTFQNPFLQWNVSWPIAKLILGVNVWVLIGLQAFYVYNDSQQIVKKMNALGWSFIDF